MDNTTATTASIESRAEFPDTPQGKHEYWKTELDSSQKTLKKWKQTGAKINLKYLGRKLANQGIDLNPSAGVGDGGFRLNLFHSNVNTLSNLLYGNVPKVDVSRRYQQADDDIGRVAAEMMERLLNNDMAENGAEYDTVLRSTLQDRLLPGLGCARVRYTAEFEKSAVAAVTGLDGSIVEPESEVEELVSEAAPVDYVFWDDVLWNWARNWKEVNWIGFRSYLTKDQIEVRFPEIDAEKLTYKQRKVRDPGNTPQETDMNSPWLLAEVWEVWDKVTRTVVWFHDDYPTLLDRKRDPLKLTQFFPCPPFFLANATTTQYEPTPDYTLSEDLYNEIDTLQTRIAIITEAVKVVGVYDESAEGVQRMLKEGVENDLIPVSNWALFAEKGGIQGAVDWYPVKDVAEVLQHLRGLRDEQIALLYQTTGMSDILRGNLDNQYEGVGQTDAKASYASIRIQALQEHFAQFASDLMQLKAEVICRHFEPSTIVLKANMVMSKDFDKVPQAVKLLKDVNAAKIRVAIRPESVAMVDFAQLKGERTDYLNALSTYLQSAGAMIEKLPGSLPFLLQMLQWGLAGFKGSSEIEGVLDKAIEQALEAQKKQEGQPKQPSPEEAKAQAAMQLEQLKGQNKMQEAQMKHQSTMQTRQQDFELDVQTFQAELQADLQRSQAEMMMALQEITAKMMADTELTIADAEANAAQNMAGIEGEIRKDAEATQNKIMADAAKAEFDMEVDDAKVMNQARLEKVKPKPNGEN